MPHRVWRVFGLFLGFALAVAMTMCLAVVLTAYTEQNSADGSCRIEVGRHAWTDTGHRGKRFESRRPRVRLALLTKEGSEHTRVESLKGAKVGVQRGTVGQAFVYDYFNRMHGSFVIVVIFENLALQGNAVITGQVDVAVNAKRALLDYARKNTGIKVTAEFCF